MGDVKDGGPAFRFEYDSTGFFGEPARDLHTGMTLRDWFAGEALPQAVLDYSNGRKERPDDDHSLSVTAYTTKAIGTREEIIARQAYRYADAMLKAREAGE